MSLALEHLVSQAVNVKCSLIASIALLFYDTALKLGDEVNLLWPSRWSLAKFLYLSIRYLSFVDASLIIYYDFSPGHSAANCHLLYQIAMWFMTAGIILCQFVLIMRTYAIWGNNIFVGCYLTLIQVVAIIVSIIYCNKSAKALLFINSPAPTVVPCIPLQGTNNTSLYAFSCVAIFDFHIIFFTLLNGFSQYRTGATPLVRTLYRDGIIYFIVLFSVSLSNVVLMKIMVDSPYFYMLTEPQRVLHTVLITRLILNVRLVASKPLGDDLSDAYEMNLPNGLNHGFGLGNSTPGMVSSMEFQQYPGQVSGIDAISHGSVTGEGTKRFGDDSIIYISKSP